MNKERRLNAAKYYISNSKLVDANCILKVSIIASTDGITSVKYRCGDNKGVVNVDDNWFSDPNNLKLAIQSELLRNLKPADVVAELETT